jgi:acyltransferase
MTPIPVQSTRYDAIDWTKTLGIILVIYGHSEALSPYLEKAIYGFHMPLFFFASGFLTSDKRLTDNFSSFVRGLARRLIKPYFIFAIINYLFWLLLARHFGADKDNAIPVISPLIGIFYGSGSGQDLLQPMVLWFFPCLTSSLLLMWLTRRLKLVIRIAVITALMICGMHAGNVILPWEIEGAVVALPFLWIGHGVRNHWQSFENLSKYKLIAVTLVGASLAWTCSQANIKIDMRSAAYGSPLLFLFASLNGIGAILALSQILPQSRIAQKISECTILSFPLHSMGYSLLAGFYVYILHQPPSFRNEPMVGIIATIILVLTFLIVSKPGFIILDLLNRYVPPTNKPNA